MINNDKQRLVFFYTLFAIISTFFNILSQEVSTRLYDGWGYIAISMIIGTAIGLLIKYILDKKFIFYFDTKSLADDSKTFFLYSLMGVLTTLIFWGVEYSFELIFRDKTMRYVGACIGLAIGYVIKYFLDKKYVFKQ